MKKIMFAVAAIFSMFIAGCGGEMEDGIDTTSSAALRLKPLPDPLPELPKLEPRDCVCPHVYDPVCGENGITYGNGCEASCAGVEVAHRGRCDGGDVVLMATLASDDDFSSRCDEVLPPKDFCICPEVIRPVCGRDGNTYDNSCLADCAGVCVDYEGECRECICPAVIDPVCGADGKNYDNACLAECAKVEVKKKGLCELDSAN